MEQLARFIRRRPVAIVCLFLIVCAAATAVHTRWSRYEFTYQTMAPHNTPEFGLIEEYERLFGTDNDTFMIAFRSDDLLSADRLAMVERITSRIEALEVTRSVLSLTNVQDIRSDGDFLDVGPLLPDGELDTKTLRQLGRTIQTDEFIGGNLVSRDLSATAIVVRISETSTELTEQFAYFTEIDAILMEEGGGRIEFYMAGFPFMSTQLMRLMMRDTKVFLPVTMACMAALLLLAYGRVRATWMPIVPVVTASFMTLGLLTACGLPMTLLTGQGMLTCLILVIGLSDGVHLLNRLHEDRVSIPDEPAENALAPTLGHVGKACLLTSATTSVGLLSLAVSDVPSVREFGIFGAIGVLFAFLGAIVMLPALIVLMERRMPTAVSTTPAIRALDSVLTGVVRIVVTRRNSIIAGGVVLLLAAAGTTPFLIIDNRPTRDLRAEDPTVQALHFLQREMDGAYPLDIFVKAPGNQGVKSAEVLHAVERLAEGMAELPWVGHVTTPVPFIKKMNRAINPNTPGSYSIPEEPGAVSQYLLLFEMDGGDREYDRLVYYDDEGADFSVARLIARVHDLRPEYYYGSVEALERLADEHLPPGVTAYVSGETPVWGASVSSLINTLLRSLYLAMPVIFLITGLAFRSLKLGLLGILPNLLPLTVGLGMLAPLDISLRFSTITAFPLAFGLAVDDTIHFLARYRSEIAAGASPEQAVATTIRTTGRAMLLTSILLIAGFATFTFSNFLGMVHVGVLISGILMAALFGDLLLLPALLLRFPRLSKGLVPDRQPRN